MDRLDKIEAITKYIGRANIPPYFRKHYTFPTSESVAIFYEMAKLEGILLAFEYGMAKGWRAAKAESRK